MRDLNQWRERFAKAALREDVEGHLVREVLSFKTAGGTEAEAEKLIRDLWSVSSQGTERAPLDGVFETVYDAVVGNCATTNHLFREDFEESDYYRPIPA